MTADELLVLPPDHLRHELVAGELRTMMPPGAGHGVVAARLLRLLAVHVHGERLGETFAAETGFILARDPDTVRAPDVAFIARERYEALGPTPKYWPEAPAFAAEVLSPGDNFGEVESNALMWLAAGTVAVLVIDPQRRTATVYRSGDDVRHHGGAQTIDLGDAVPGFAVALAELFD